MPYCRVAIASGNQSVGDVVAFGRYVEHQKQQLAVDMVTTRVVALPDFVQLHNQCQLMQVNVNNAEVVSVVVCVPMSTCEAHNTTQWEDNSTRL